MTHFQIPVGNWMAELVNWSLVHLAGAFDVVTYLVGGLVDNLQIGLTAVPVWAMAVIVVAVAAWRVGWRFAIFSALAVMLIVGMNLWLQTMATFALIIASTFISLIVGLPAGVLAAKSRIAQAVIRPILDLMQTMPSFVYLIPAAMFFGLGKVPGTIATIVFAMPPAVRLTDLGIRGVNRELTEAGRAFGCTPAQLLFRVQLPAALPSIMAGVNQTVMLALSMVVIASMIGAGGLGNEVLAGIQRLDIGRGFEGGFAVVALAIVLDRISQSFGVYRPRQTALKRWATALLKSGRSQAPGAQ